MGMAPLLVFSINTIFNLKSTVTESKVKDERMKHELI